MTSRRSFMSGAGAAMVGAALAGKAGAASPQAQEAPIEPAPEAAPPQAPPGAQADDVAVPAERIDDGGAAAAIATPPSTLARSALPSILPPVGDMGNNGAVTFAFPLPQAYPAAYMYFMAGAIAAGSPAGLYFVVMSSTTSGRVYNNRQSGPSPLPPANPTPFVTTGPGRFSQTRSPVDLRTVTVPGGALGLTGMLQIEAAWSMPNNINAKTVSITYGGANVYGKTRTFISNEMPLIDVRNRGVSNRQISSWANSGGPIANSTAGFVNLRIDSTVNQLMHARGQIAVLGDYVVLESMDVTLRPFT